MFYSYQSRLEMIKLVIKQDCGICKLVKYKNLG